MKRHRTDNATILCGMLLFYYAKCSIKVDKYLQIMLSSCKGLKWVGFQGGAL